MKNTQVCWECQRERERCRAVTVNEYGRVEYVCPQCFNKLDYAKYLYKYRETERTAG